MGKIVCFELWSASWKITEEINVVHNTGLNVTSLLNEIKIKCISGTFLSESLIGLVVRRIFSLLECSLSG